MSEQQDISPEQEQPWLESLKKNLDKFENSTLEIQVGSTKVYEQVGNEVTVNQLQGDTAHQVHLALSDPQELKDSVRITLDGERVFHAKQGELLENKLPLTPIPQVQSATAFERNLVKPGSGALSGREGEGFNNTDNRNVQTDNSNKPSPSLLEQNSSPSHYDHSTTPKDFPKYGSPGFTGLSLSVQSLEANLENKPNVAEQVIEVAPQSPIATTSQFEQNQTETEALKPEVLEHSIQVENKLAEPAETGVVTYDVEPAEAVKFDVQFELLPAASGTKSQPERTPPTWDDIRNL